MKNQSLHHIRICMGSSCHCRGNARNAELIQQELRDKGLEGQIELTGTLCEGHCKDGPIITLDGREYQRVQAGMAADIVQLVIPSARLPLDQEA